MSEKRVALFSSDATDLYRGDVFRVLALPEICTIQFRYPKKYVQKAFRDAPETLISRQATIFFVGGNDLKIAFNERKLVSIPVRSCVIKESLIDANSDQLLLILELGQFIECAVDNITNPADLPPQTFVSEIDVDQIRNSSWIERVKKVEGYFPNTLFYHLQSIFAAGVSVLPKYSSNRRRSFYELIEETEYALECTCYDRTGGNIPLEIESKSQELVFLNPFEGGTRAHSDTQRILMTTRSLQTQSSPAFAVFYSQANDAYSDKNNLEICWTLVRKPWKAISFGFLTALAAIFLAMSQSGLQDDKGQFFNCINVGVRFLGALGLGLIASQLFRYFNKTS
jgi:hypothetical protein